MNTVDENSEPSKRRGKRRSSILKIPKSPGNALDDIDPNTENLDENAVQSKKSRRSSIRRVSFARTCQVKEIPNKELEKINPDDFTINEDTPVSPLMIHESTRDNSMYRQPAQTLAGLPSLLTSPIHEVPPSPSFSELLLPGDNLDLTCCQPKSDMQDVRNQTQDAMEMTKNYQDWEMNQSNVLTSRHSITNKFSPEKIDGQLDFTCSHGEFIENNELNKTVQAQDMMEMTRNYQGWELEQSSIVTRKTTASKFSPKKDDGQLDFTRSHGAFIENNQLNKTVQAQDMMEMTRNYQGWELEQSTVLTRQVATSKASFPRPKEPIKTAEPSFLSERQNITQSSRPTQSSKIKASSFLRQLEAKTQRKTREVSNSKTSIFADASCLSNKITHQVPEISSEMEFTQCHNVQQLSQQNNDNLDITQNQMEMTRNYENWEKTESYMVSLKTNDHDIRYKRPPQKDGNSESNHGRQITQASKFQDINEDISVNMKEMRREYENNWENIRKPENVMNRHSADINNDLEFTQCHGQNIQQFSEQNNDDLDITENQMEMTRNYENWEEKQSYIVPLKNPDDNISYKHSQKDDNLEFTRCQAGNIETSNIQDVSVNMNMTRCYQNWGQENSKMFSTSRNESNFQVKDQRSPEKDNDLELTCHQTGNIETSKFQHIDEDISVNMDMTRDYQNWGREKLRSESDFHAKNKYSLEKDHHSELSGCQAENTRILQSAAVFKDVTRQSDMMEMRKGHENWEEDNFNMASMPPRNMLKKSRAVPLSNLGENPVLTNSDVSNQKLNISNQKLNVSKQKLDISNLKLNASNQKLDSSNQKLDVSNQMLDVSNQMLDVSNQMLGVSSHEEKDRSMTMTKNSLRHEEIQKPQTSLMSISKNQTSFLATWNATKPDEIQENEKSMLKMNVSKNDEIVDNQRSMVNVSRYIEVSRNEVCSENDIMKEKVSNTSLLKVVPRVSSSKITIDKNFERFEIKMPTSRVSRPSVLKSEEKQEAVDSEEKQQRFGCKEEHSSIKCEEKEAGIESGKHDVIESSDVIRTQNMSISNIDQEESLHVTAKPDSEEMETSAVLDQHDHVDSTAEIKMSLPEAKNTTETEQMDTNISEFKRSIVEEKSNEPYTLKEFMYNAGISFLPFASRRSENPMFRRAIPKELRDKIYSRSLSKAKLEFMEDFAELLQKEITENKESFAAKEKELNATNPPVFAKLKDVLGADNEDSEVDEMPDVLGPEKEDPVVDMVQQLKRLSDTKAKRLWYVKKREMRKDVLVSLQEEEKKVFSDLSILQNHQNELEQDMSMLEKVETDCDKQIKEIEVALVKEEKEWSAYIKNTEELKQKIETLELELTLKEEKRVSLSSSKETLTSEIVELKRKASDIENTLDKLQEEKTLRESNDKEIQKLLSYQTALYEWILLKCEKAELHFTFLGQTLDLIVLFENDEKIKDIQLNSELSDKSTSLAKLGHKLVLENFAHCDFLTTFPTRKKLKQLLHQLSLACVRVRLLLEQINKFSINHIISLNGEILTAEFSSLAKYMKFIVNFDLSKIVTDGIIPFNVVRKIGNTSADAISENLKKFPPKVEYLSKILKEGDEIMRC